VGHGGNSRRLKCVIGVDRDPEDDDDTECPLPAFEDPDLPAHFKENYFGCPYDGHVYESQRDYLKRHKLLLPEEKKSGRIDKKEPITNVKRKR
jgi:hypothetical protein